MNFADFVEVPDVDYKAKFEALRNACTEYPELIDGRYPRTLRELQDYQRNQHAQMRGQN
jgi:hypothetical protein